MNEHSFIKAVHRHLDRGVKVWKVIDDFHGGVSDVVYFAPKGGVMLFVEYKFAPQLPKRDRTIPSKLKLKPQQHLWHTDLQRREVPIAAIFGVAEPNTGGVWVEDEIEAKEGLTKREILDRWQSAKDLATHITRVLGGPWEDNT